MQPQEKHQVYKRGDHVHVRTAQYDGPAVVKCVRFDSAGLVDGAIYDVMLLHRSVCGLLLPTLARHLTSTPDGTREAYVVHNRCLRAGDDPRPMRDFSLALFFRELEWRSFNHFYQRRQLFSGWKNFERQQQFSQRRNGNS